MAPKAPKAPKEAGAEAQAAVAPSVSPIHALEARVSELEGDLLRIAKLCGGVWGDPFASSALEIVNKRQGK